MKNKVKITLGEPVVIAQATPDVKHWGPFQFPSINRQSDGKLHCRYHIELDSATAYGLDGGHAVSGDEGESWAVAPDYKGDGALELPNGDRVRTGNKAAIKVTEKDLPAQFLCEALLSSTRVPLYEPDSFPYEWGGMYLERLKKGENEWVEERVDLFIPYMKRYVVRGLLPYESFIRFRLAPDGALWSVMYPFTYKDNVAGMTAVFMRSDDCGHSWKYMSGISYKPDLTDMHWALRAGYTEPNLTFNRDGSLFCVLRTDDSFFRGPSYCAYSYDGAKTWTEPKRFDDRGVWPSFTELNCGVTLVGYGRPGLYVRATADPGAKVWDDRVELMPQEQQYYLSCEKCPMQPLSDDMLEQTCSYCDLIPLNDDTAYCVYSHFSYPNGKGEKCKAILGRTIKVEIV